PQRGGALPPPLSHPLRRRRPLPAPRVKGFPRKLREDLMTQPARHPARPAAPPWPERRRRALDLADRWPHAAGMLRLYAALVDVQEPASRMALNDRPAPVDLADYVASHICPQIVATTIAAGPSLLPPPFPNPPPSPPP